MQNCDQTTVYMYFGKFDDKNSIAKYSSQEYICTTYINYQQRESSCNWWY